MPLSIAVVAGSPVPIYQQIIDQIAGAVVAGSVAEQEPLPSVRALADELLINPNTVARAYAELSRRGIIETHGPLGTFVSMQSDRHSQIERALDAFIADAARLGFTRDEILARVEEKAAVLPPRRTDKRKGGSR